MVVFKFEVIEHGDEARLNICAEGHESRPILGRGSSVGWLPKQDAYLIAAWLEKSMPSLQRAVLSMTTEEIGILVGAN